MPREERNTFPDIPGEIRMADSSALDAFLSALRTRPVELDIGCGHGDFLLHHAPASPERLFVGVEISRKRVHKTAHRLAKRSIPNFRMIHSDGETALSCCFPKQTVDAIHVNFPDPWLRKRQWKNRILRPSFLIQALRVLKDGGTFNFVTDVREYAEEAARILSDFPGFKNRYDAPIRRDVFSSFPTLFYRKMSPLRPINYISHEKRMISDSERQE